MEIFNIALPFHLHTATAQNDPTALAAHEAEINRIVHRLFDLTPEEIALIESTLDS